MKLVRIEEPRHKGGAYKVRHRTGSGCGRPGEWIADGGVVAVYVRPPEADIIDLTSPSAVEAGWTELGQARTHNPPNRDDVKRALAAAMKAAGGEK